jgi:hypothetical protein
MKWQQMIFDQFLRIEQEMGLVLDGLSVEDLNRQPAPDCNSIGWCVWHLTRSHDRNMSEMMGAEQLWIRDKWYARFNRAADPGETGVGHTTEQVAAFICPSGELIKEYHRAIVGQVRVYIEERLAEEELDRIYTSPTFKTKRNVEGALIGVIQQGFLHVGQAGYVRGMLKGKGWYH